MKSSFEKFGAQKYIPFKLKPVKKPLVTWREGELPKVQSLEDFTVLYSYLPFEAVGFECGQNYVVIDVDNKNGKIGSSLLDIWIEDYELDLSDCYYEKTPSGGFHYYIENDSGKPIGTNKKYSSQGIDILGQNSLCILYGAKGQNDSLFIKLSELPKKFVHEVINSRTQKEAHQLEGESIDFGEAVKLLSFFPANYWDDRDSWAKYMLLFADTMTQDDAITLSDRFMNQEAWAARTGGEIQQTNKSFFRRNRGRSQGNKFSWGGVRNEATEYGYEDPDVELELGFLKKKEPKKQDGLTRKNKGEMPFPPGLAGRLAKSFIQKSKCTRDQGIIFCSQLLPALLFSDKIYAHHRNIGIYLIQIGLSNAGKSYQLSALEREIKRLKHAKWSGFDRQVVSSSSLMKELNESRSLNMKVDEGVQLMSNTNEWSPMPVFLEIFNAMLGDTVSGRAAIQEKSQSVSVVSPVVNLILNDTPENWDAYKTSRNMKSGMTRRLDIIWSKRHKMAHEDHMTYYQNIAVKKFSDQDIKTLDKICERINSIEEYINLELTPEAMGIFAEHMDWIEAEVKKPTCDMADVYLTQKDKILEYAARVTPLLGELKITAQAAKWAVELSKYNIHRYVEVYTNEKDEIYSLVEKAHKRLVESKEKNKSLTRLLRELVRHDQYLRSDLKDLLMYDPRFKIVKRTRGFTISLLT